MKQELQMAGQSIEEKLKSNSEYFVAQNKVVDELKIKIATHILQGTLQIPWTGLASQSMRLSRLAERFVSCSQILRIVFSSNKGRNIFSCPRVLQRLPFCNLREANADGEQNKLQTIRNWRTQANTRRSKLEGIYRRHQVREALDPNRWSRQSVFSVLFKILVDTTQTMST